MGEIGTLSVLDFRSLLLNCSQFLPIVLFLDFSIEDPVSSENHSSFITQLHIRTCYWIEKYSDQCWNCGCSAIHIGAFDKDLWLWDWPTYMGRDIITLKNIRTTVEIVAGLFKLGPLTSPCQAHMVFNIPCPEVFQKPTSVQPNISSFLYSYHFTFHDTLHWRKIEETNWSPLNPIKPQIIPLKTMNPKSKGVLKKFNRGPMSVGICLQN